MRWLPGAFLSLWVLALIAPGQAVAQGGSALFSVGDKAGERPVKKATATAPKAIVKPVQRSRARGKKIVKKNPSPIALNGRWHDVSCIPLTGVSHNPPLFVKRHYEFVEASRAWRLAGEVFSSEACVADSRLLTYHGTGTFEVLGKSKVAGNAYEASFAFERWTATPDTRDGVLMLLNGRCGSGDFERGRHLELSRTGCATLGIRAIAQSPREIELVNITGGKFFLGARSFVPGLSDERPAQLSSYGLTRTP